MEIIKEEIQLSEEPEAERLGQGSTTASQAKQDFVQSGKSMTDPDITGKERTIMNRMQKLIHQAASELDIGTGGEYAFLERVYKLLGSEIKKQQQKQGSADEQK